MSQHAPEDGPFRTRLTMRSTDEDTNGHVRGSAYVEYADQARWECVREAGISTDELAAARLGPVNLETTVRFHRELRAGEEIEISCVFHYGEGKTSRVEQELRRTSDGELCATVASVGGILDLESRRLVPDPASVWRKYATRPGLMGVRAE
ncbi:thioesterase family protein [Streptomyces sp. ODS28]|uniref:acyl-CoA thioesterase n=1 Tax=Streptomyces sp. ODS28 TaxID=3136688 RepID=UPI0031E9F101